MKTQTLNSFRVAVMPIAIAVSLIAAMTLLESCKSGGESKTNDSTQAAPIKGPEIDIHTAVLSENMDAVKQHIAAGSNLNEKDPFGGSSPLITAALFDKKEMVKVLLDAGVDINFQNNDGSTALHVAAFFCRPEIVKLLLDKGADKTIQNRFGATALQSVEAPFADVKSAYDMMGQMLAPMGLKLDYTYIEKTRPEIATMLK